MMCHTPGVLRKIDTNLSKFIHYIGWTPSNYTIFKINTDGASFSNTEIAAIRAVIQNYLGEFVVGLAANSGVAIIITAEVWTI